MKAAAGRYAPVPVDSTADVDHCSDDQRRGSPPPAETRIGGDSVDGSEGVAVFPRDASPGLLKRLTRLATKPFRDLYKFFHELCVEFGWRFVAIVVLVYGFNQGFGEGYLSQGRLYYLKDVMKLQPTETTTVLAAAHIPWNMKTIYGSWSDALPIFGFHRTPYIAIAGLLGTVAWANLAVGGATTVFVATLMLFLINLSIASPDVIIDASVAERVAEKPQFGPALQSLCWGAFAVGGIGSCLSAGWLNEAKGPTFLFAIGAATSLAILVPAILNWLHESPGSKVSFTPQTTLKREEEKNAAVASGGARSIPAAVIASSEAADQPRTNRQCVRVNLGALREHWLLFVMAYIIAGCAIALGLVGFYLSTDGIMIATVVVAFIVCCATYCLLSLAVPAKRLRGSRSTVLQKLRDGGLVAKPVLFVFLNGCVQPSVSDTMFYWMTDDLCGNVSGLTLNATRHTGVEVSSVADVALSDAIVCDDHGPMFDQIFISHMDCAAYAGFIFGIVVYNKYLSHVPYRLIFVIASLALVLISLLDLVFVLRLHLHLGISDRIFAIGDNAVAPIARRFYTMPMFVLAAKLCPPGMEATLFASIMALSNFGGDVGAYFGIVLQRVFNVSRGHYENLWVVILIKTVCKAIPAVLTFMLIPHARPEDDIIEVSSSPDSKGRRPRPIEPEPVFEVLDDDGRLGSEFH